MSEHTIKSMRASAVSMLARLKVEMDGNKQNYAEYRLQIEAAIDEFLDTVRVDQTSWSYFKGKMFYDIYLLQREEEGTLSELDMVRPGLKSVDFADPVEFHKHCVRVGETRQAPELGPPKVCTACGEEKPANKFKHRGGAKCNACRSREYRERKNAY